MSRQPSRTEGHLRPAIQLANAQCEALAELLSVGSAETSPLLLRSTAASIAGVPREKALELPFASGGSFENMSCATEGRLQEFSVALAEVLQGLPLPPAYSIGALAEAHVGGKARRASGVYFTDFLIAERVVGRALASHHTDNLRCVDPSAGGGAFLVAAARQIEQCFSGRRKSAFIAEDLCGVDRDAAAVDACASALLVESRDLSAIAALSERLRVADSLLAGSPRLLVSGWREMFPAVFGDPFNGFGLVVGNPPWEKLKIHAHEHLSMTRAAGAGSYGTASEMLLHERRELTDRRAVLRAYVEGLQKSGFVLQDGGGDPDLYRYFFELSLELAAETGTVALLLPGALVRAQGAEPLRAALSSRFPHVDLLFFDNRAKFFPIDTRFKFVACIGSTSAANHAEVNLSSAQLGADTIEVTPATRISKKEMEVIDRGAGIPELLAKGSKDAFLRCIAAGPSSTVSGWGGQVMREVDMTRDKASFRRSPHETDLPVVEGRMVHQFLHATKAYVRGEGRSAEWVNTSSCEVHPQYWISPAYLSEGARARSWEARAGFCDITGQTNERTLLASVIPAQTVCGNKVPTVAFEDHSLMYAWVALMNTFVVDWIVRRICTTTINYFILDAIPLPSPDKVVPGLSELGESLSWCGSHDVGRRHALSVEASRIETDLRTLELYGLSVDDLCRILGDFPLLDRSQPPIFGEPRSTITRDTLLLAALQRWDSPAIRVKGSPTLDQLEERTQAASDLGAQPYVPTDLGRGSDVRSGQGDLLALVEVAPVRA